MPVRWIRAYLTMLPRLQAEEAIRSAEVTLLPYHKTDRHGHSASRKAWLERMQRQAMGALGTGDYDAHGRRILRSSNDLRAFFNAHFAAAGLRTLNA